ncbi:hypothetical protein CYLTODRAFT_387891 [Cylindrobasidium torrendii FP15055 ss-10]|uniref:Uncharacterized protein n=1 Tax=Cylindrobasidium torrendii FP15055 ss-10 TaxID=1314674 RepID=A0A0D7BR20_9AGAR|nr:hypothetical protein CYLTODRAFT_387891 [Cylindrobasidium torrendii FP15055 ss-10]
MFNFQGPAPGQTDADMAVRALKEESEYRFPSFSAQDAVTLGLSIRKRFRGSNRHAKGRGLVLSIETIAGHTLFSCTVGDLGHLSGIGDVSLDSWACLQGMVGVVKRTGHSSYYVEKSMSAQGKRKADLLMTAGSAAAASGEKVYGGAFPIWLENAPCCPIGVVAAFSGSPQEDHTLVVHTVRDYINKMREGQPTPAPSAHMPMPQPSMVVSSHYEEQPEHEQHQQTEQDWRSTRAGSIIHTHHTGTSQPLPVPPAGSEYDDSLYP